MNVQSSIFHNTKDMRIIQILTDEWINVIQPYSGIVFSPKKKWSTDLHYNMNEHWKHTKLKKGVTEDRLLCDSIYMKCPE